MHIARDGHTPHNLMLPSMEPDTIVVPSGEKLTESTFPLWAFVCSATGANVDASVCRNKCARLHIREHRFASQPHA